MSIITCPECENEVSDRAPSCPHCGFVISYRASYWNFVRVRLAEAANILMLSAFIFGYMSLAGVEILVAPNNIEIMRELALVSFMTESSPNFSQDGYFWNDQIFLLLIDNTYYGFAFGQGAIISIPAVQSVLQSMYAFVVLLIATSFLIVISIIKFLFGR